MAAASTTWQCCDGTIDLRRPVLVGILNVTPDSFSDGGKYIDAAAAVSRGRDLVEEGAAIIDIGGESTRPGASRVSEQEQINRVLPVIRGLRGTVPLSIDTTRVEVAEAAVEAGVSIVNDVSAGTEDGDMLPFVADRRAGMVLMHRVAAPPDDQFSTDYAEEPQCAGDDIVQTVQRFLEGRVAAAVEAGMSRECIAIDPGLGFGKSVRQNWELMRRMEEFVGVGLPVWGGASRKSFLGAVAGIADAEERDGVSAAAAAMMMLGGVQLFRVHDVRRHHHLIELLDVAAAL
ncbi:MAG: dihydropteroate synthase [Phycisphaerales bacterium]|jgi:dihydropteroate synthase|nr:dihydropteroate synthase [Phycisphaerales bacterium]